MKYEVCRRSRIVSSIIFTLQGPPQTNIRCPSVWEQLDSWCRLDLFRGIVMENSMTTVLGCALCHGSRMLCKIVIVLGEFSRTRYEAQHSDLAVNIQSIAHNSIYMDTIDHLSFPLNPYSRAIPLTKPICCLKTLPKSAMRDAKDSRRTPLVKLNTGKIPNSTPFC